MNAEIFDYGGYYLIAMMSPGRLEVIKEILSDFWSLYIVNTNVLVMEEESCEVVVYTYFPFQANRCEQVNPIVVNYFLNGSFLLTNDFFVDKFKDMQGCEVGVAVYDYQPLAILTNESGILKLDGVDLRSIVAISEMMNFTPVMKYITEKINFIELSLRMVKFYKKSHYLIFLNYLTILCS